MMVYIYITNPPAVGKLLDRQAFNLSMAISIGEGKCCIKTC